MTSSTSSSKPSYEQHPDVVWGDVPAASTAEHLPEGLQKLTAAKLASCRCVKCNGYKPTAEFYRTNRLKTEGTCKKCWAAYISEHRKANLAQKDKENTEVEKLKEDVKVSGAKIKTLEGEIKQLVQAFSETTALIKDLDTKMSTYMLGAQTTQELTFAPEPPASTRPTSPPKPAALATDDLRAALKQSRENPATPVKMDNYYLLGGTPCAYGMNKSVTTDVDHIKPYTTEFEPTWKQMRKEDKLAQIEADKDNPLADLM